tara:strand:- start:709 stop:1134 length:426 start_codon:yes stop_codon:yes gene_type:complete
LQSNAFDAPRRAPATQESPTPTRGPASQADGEADPRGDRATSDLVEALKALASDKRLAVLGWLRDPTAHFPPQRDGDLVRDGVCALFLAEKLGVSQPTLHRHMQLLIGAGLVVAKRTRQWTFYRRDERRIAALAARIGQAV